MVYGDCTDLTIDIDSDEEDLPVNDSKPKTISIELEDEEDLPVNDIAPDPLPVKPKPTRHRNRANKVTCRPGNQEVATTMMADPKDVEYRHNAIDAVCGVIEPHYSDFCKQIKENMQKTESEAMPRKTSFRSPDTTVYESIDDATITRILSNRSDMMGGTLNAVLSAMPYNLPTSPSRQPIDAVLRDIPLVSMAWIQENLVQPHGNWPACSKRLTDQNRHQPRTIHQWNNSMCAILLCDIGVPFSLRAFYPRKADADVYEREQRFPQSDEMCVLCQIFRTDIWYNSVREQYTISLPPFHVQRFRVEVGLQNEFSEIFCNIPSDRGFHGLSAPTPMFLPACIKRGAPRINPKNIVPLQTLTLDYTSAQEQFDKVQRFWQMPRIPGGPRSLNSHP